MRQVLGSPTTAKALTPGVQAPERDRKTAAHHLRDLLAYVRLRARELHGTGRDTDLLLVGQKAAIDALRAAGLPPRVDAVHFNGLSGLDRWGDVGGLIVLGRTLPAPATVEALCAALTGQMPIAAAEGSGWWYGTEERRIRLAGGRTHAVPGEVHADPTAEAIRWSICEAELIQAMGRGRGVNSGSVGAFDVGNGPKGIAAGAGALWVVSSLSNQLVKVRVDDWMILDTWVVGNEPDAVAFDDDRVFVANRGSLSVSMIRLA